MGAYFMSRPRARSFGNISAPFSATVLVGGGISQAITCTERSLSLTSGRLPEQQHSERAVTPLALAEFRVPAAP